MVRRLIDILCDFLGSFIMSIGIFSFVEPINIAPGGVSGIALMANYLAGVPVGAAALAINVPLIIAGWRFLGKECVIKTIITATISSIVLDWVVTPFFPQYEGSPLLAAVFGGALMGLGMSIIFRRGSTTGGTDIVSHIIKLKWPLMPIGMALLAVDSTVIAASVLVFGNIESGMYAIICLYWTVKVIDMLVPNVKDTMEETVRG